MKLYNPFKPHLVQTDEGKFAIRELSILYYGWIYWDKKDNYKWSIARHVREWCLYDSLTEADKALRKYSSSKKAIKSKVVST